MMLLAMLPVAWRATSSRAAVIWKDRSWWKRSGRLWPALTSSFEGLLTRNRHVLQLSMHEVNRSIEIVRARVIRDIE